MILKNLKNRKEYTDHLVLNGTEELDDKIQLYNIESQKGDIKRNTGVFFKPTL
jgi:hypothetical protein